MTSVGDTLHSETNVDALPMGNSTLLLLKGRNNMSTVYAHEGENEKFFAPDSRIEDCHLGLIHTGKHTTKNNPS